MHAWRDFLDSLPTDHILRMVVDEYQIPDYTVEVCRDHLDTLTESFEQHRAQWEYIGPWFRLAARNKALAPAPMPVIALLSLTVGRVPSLDTLADVFAASRICETTGNQLDARLYQFLTAFLRELHVALCIMRHDEKAVIAKNFRNDLIGGVDWKYRNGIGEIKSIAIGHSGETSRRYLRMKKMKKMPDDVIYLEAAQSEDGLHLVDIDSILRSISK